MRKQRLLILGCGDVARRALASCCQRWQVSAFTRHPDPALAAQGVEVLAGDLDRPDTLAALSRAYERVIHFAPPPGSGERDMRSAHAIHALSRAAILPERMVYISTSGVYGDCGGERVDETRPPAPLTDRARRRLDAEGEWLAWGQSAGVNVAVLRVPGIYAADRLPLERLRRSTPVLSAAEDVYTNHIHADDLAAACVAALERAAPGSIYNVCDDSEIKMGDYLDLVADRFSFERAPRIDRERARGTMAPLLFSFMSESRRLINARMKRELGVALRYPTVFEGVPHGCAAGDH